MLQFLHQMFNLFTLLRDDPLKPATPLTNGARSMYNAVIVCPTQWRLLASASWCRESSPLLNHLLKGTPNSAIDCIQVRAVIATCEARWTWRSHAAGTSVCSWAPGCVLRRHPCKMPVLFLQDVTVTLASLANNWDNKHVVPWKENEKNEKCNDLKCVQKPT